MDVYKYIDSAIKSGKSITIKYVKYNGTKYYFDSTNERIFYYSNGNLFPKFFFPIPVSLSDKNDFSLKVKKNMVFEAPNYTPQKVCEEYFKYIYRIVSRKIENIQIEFKEMIMQIFF